MARTGGTHMAGRNLTPEDIRDDVADYKHRALLHLEQGFGSLETAVDVKCLIERAAEIALRHGLEDELLELRRIHERIEAATYAFLLDQIPFDLDHGEYPPEDEWKWSDYEHTITRSRAWGLDVTEAEQALTRARQVAAAWARGYDEPEHEEERRQQRARRRSIAGVEDAVTGATEHGAPVQAGPAPDEDGACERRPVELVSPDLAVNAPDSEMEEAQLVGTSACDKVRDSPQPDPPASSAPRPRFSLAGDLSAEALQRHFLEVEAAIPARRTGAATAVELWQAIREAHHHGALPLTGNWVDLVSVLHHRGLLSHLPSDRASRAALTILGELTPLVRRLHHRRWFIDVGP